MPHIFELCGISIHDRIKMSNVSVCVRAQNVCNMHRDSRPPITPFVGHCECVVQPTANKQTAACDVSVLMLIDLKAVNDRAL